MFGHKTKIERHGASVSVTRTKTRHTLFGKTETSVKKTHGLFGPTSVTKSEKKTRPSLLGGSQSVTKTQTTRNVLGLKYRTEDVTFSRTKKNAEGKDETKSFTIRKKRGLF